MTITTKDQVDKVVGAFKLLVRRRRKDIVQSQEKQAELVAKEKEKGQAPSP